ncbi:MAG: SIS domain-containing protein [Vicinamibacterales bacterium]
MPVSVLESEIHEQPAILARLLSAGAATVDRIADRLSGRGLHHVVIAARGSSDNAARYAQYLFGVHNEMTVTLATPSVLTRYHARPRMQGSLVIGISQSGESPDLIAVVEEARRQGCPTLAITNAPGSPLASAADDTLLLLAETERSVAATKTYTAQLMTLAMLSSALAGDGRRRGELASVPELVRQTLLAAPGQVARAVEAMAGIDHAVVLGRGFNFATAHELALKLKELAQVAAEPYSAADFQHGPIALVETGFAAIVICASGAVQEEIESLIAEMLARGSRPIVVSDRATALAGSPAPIHLPPAVPEWLSPLVAIVPGQLLAMELARARELDPDRPRSLQKVTRTR